MSESGKWQKYKYAVAALIAIMVFCGFLFSYVAVVTSASASATKALDNIIITNCFQHQPNCPNTVGISDSITNYSIALGQEFNITNTSDKIIRLTLTCSAALTAIGAEQTNYCLDSIAIPITITSHSSQVISADLNRTVPFLNLTISGFGGYFGYSFSVDASTTANYLFWHPTVGYKAFDFNGSIVW